MPYAPPPRILFRRLELPHIEVLPGCGGIRILYLGTFCG